MPQDPTAVKVEHRDGSSTVIQQFTPTGDPKMVCAIFPAMGVHASYYAPLAKQLAQQGIVAVTCDLRGNDGSSIRPGRSTDFGYREMVELDYASIVHHIREQHPGIPVFLFGHSLGGQLSCLFAAKQPSLVDGLILSATCSVYYRGWPGRASLGILFGTQTAHIISQVLGYFPGKKLGFGGLEAKSVIRDWSRQARTGKYVLRNDPFDYETALNQLELPVLAISYEGDDLAVPGAVEHLLGKMANCQKTHTHLKKKDPRNVGFNHFSWAKKPENIVNLVTDWLQTPKAP